MITIHMTTYCRFRSGLLPQAVDSVLNQSFADFELIICDDNSVDGTAAYLQDLVQRDSRVRTFRHSYNVNSVSISLGECLQMSDPARPWVSWMFDDCVLHPDAFRLLMEGVAQQDVEMLFGSSDVHLPKGGVFRVGEKSVEDIRANISKSSALVPNGGIIIHRSIFDQIGWYDPSIVLRRSCDWDLFRRIIESGVRFGTIPEMLIEEHGELQADSLRNAFTTTFDMMAKFIRARDLANVRLSIDNCLTMPQDWIPPGDWTSDELSLMKFMFIEYFLSVGDMAKALLWAHRLHQANEMVSLTLQNLLRVSGEDSSGRALMAGGAYAAMVYNTYKRQLSDGIVL